MTKEELEKLKSTVKQWLFHTGSLDPTNYANELKLKFIEPREKQIQIDAEQIRALQKQNGELTDKVQELKTENSTVWAMVKEKDKQIGEFEKLPRKVKELEAQIEKLIDFVLSKTECCDVCPITDTCINSEGTCPYAGILAKGEEEVTREWLMQFISKEIKEK